MQGLSRAALREALRPTPAKLLASLLVTIAASLAWGVAAAYTAVARTSAANHMVVTTGPLSFYAQRIYQSLSDADATEATAFLAVIEPPSARAGFRADIDQAGTYLRAITAADPAADSPGPASAGAARSDLITLDTEIPEYTMLIGQAKANNADGLPIGASYLEEASYLMRSQLLPAAADLYRQENARLANSYAKATGFPLIAVIIAVLAAFALLRVQRWLTSHTHRALNRGLAAASLAGALSLTWLLVSFFAARSSLVTAHDHGVAAAQPLVQAEITVLRAHADESLTLINHSGDDANEADFKRAEKQLGPGTGTLLSKALAAGVGSPGYHRAMAAGNAATAWYALHSAVRALDNAGHYPEAVYLAIGSGPAASPAVIQQQEAALTEQVGQSHPSTSATAFVDVEGDLTAAIDADYASFTASASNGDNTLGGLTVGMIIVSLVMAAGCAWGLNQRLAEYR